MIRKVEYETTKQYDNLLVEAENNKEKLVKVENLKNGNFLTFEVNEFENLVAEKLTAIETRLKAIEEGQDSLRSLSK